MTGSVMGRRLCRAKPSAEPVMTIEPLVTIVIEIWIKMRFLFQENELEDVVFKMTTV